MQKHTHAFEQEIIDIEQRNSSIDNLDVLFYGSSSIRLWSTLKDDFKSYNVLNHGFGGAKISDAIYYYHRLVKPYPSKAIVVFVGSNDMDISQKKHFHVLKTFHAFKKLYKMHEKNFDIPFIYILITPTIRRENMWDKTHQFNQKVLKFAEKKDQLHILDLTHEFLKNGKPNELLFIKDGLHLSNAGYEIWKKAVNQKLKQLNIKK